MARTLNGKQNLGGPPAIGYSKQQTRDPPSTLRRWGTHPFNCAVNCTDGILTNSACPKPIRGIPSAPPAKMSLIYRTSTITSGLPFSMLQSPPQ